MEAEEAERQNWMLILGLGEWGLKGETKVG